MCCLGAHSLRLHSLVRCLSLWTNRITTRTEMVRMIEDCLADKAPEFMDKFKAAIGTHPLSSLLTDSRLSTHRCLPARSPVRRLR